MKFAQKNRFYMSSFIFAVQFASNKLLKCLKFAQTDKFYKSFLYLLFNLLAECLSHENGDEITIDHLLTLSYSNSNNNKELFYQIVRSGG